MNVKGVVYKDKKMFLQLKSINADTSFFTSSTSDKLQSIVQHTVFLQPLMSILPFISDHTLLEPTCLHLLTFQKDNQYLSLTTRINVIILTQLDILI